MTVNPILLGNRNLNQNVVKPSSEEFKNPDLSHVFGPVENFTSVDFYEDPSSRINTQAGILNDHVRISTFQKFILGNKRLFQVKRS